MIIKVIIVSIIGGILCLDRVIVQAMICRPVVAAPLIGLILGDPYTGLIAGALIELLWIDRLPIGGYIPPNDTVVSILVAASAIETARLLGRPPQELIVPSLLLYLPLGIVAQKLERRIILGSEKLAREAVEGASAGDTRLISRNHLKAILRYYLMPTGLIMIALPIGIALMGWLYPRFTPPITRGLELLYSFLPLLGAAVALNTVHIRGTIPIFCLVFLAATAIIALVRNV